MFLSHNYVTVSPSQLLCLTGHCENFTHFFICDNFSLTDTATQLNPTGQSDFHWCQRICHEKQSASFSKLDSFFSVFSPVHLSSSFILQQFQENRHTPSCSEQAKRSWLNPSQLLSWGETMASETLHFPESRPTRIPW